MPTVLIVDDQPENLRVLFGLLSAEGLAVLVARDGASALERARLTRPDLVLLDVRMPGLDGFSVIEALKADKATAAIPVLFMTALTDTPDKVRGFGLGAADWITKPFQQDEVLARVRAHLELALLRQQLERRNRELQAYAHTVAHDLKRPLGSVVGSAELLARRVGDDPKLRPGLDRIARAGLRMAETIDALLLLAETAHTEQIPRSLLDNERLLRQVIEVHLHDRVEALGATLTLPKHWPPTLGYGPWVRQVWLNLLENALNYGGRPPVLSVEAHAEGEWVRFVVRDNGAGLRTEDSARLFTPFTRLQPDRLPGHGLGLAIVLRIVSRLGGEVGVDSEPGQGSAFWFTLPGAASA